MARVISDQANKVLPDMKEFGLLNKVTQMSLDQFLAYCYLTARDNRFKDISNDSDNGAKRFATLKIDGQYQKPCLIYEYVLQAILSAFEARKDNDEELLNEERKQIMDSVEDYWQICNMRKNEDRKLAGSAYYQCLTDYELEGNVFDDLKKKKTEMSLATFFMNIGSPQTSVNPDTPMKIEQHLSNKVTPVLRSLFERKESEGEVTRFLANNHAEYHIKKLLLRLSCE